MEDEDKEIPEPKEAPKEVSIVDEARAIRDEIKAEKEALIKERETLQKVQSEALLSSTAGGHVEAPQISEVDKKVNDAADYFKGSQLEKDIRKANE